MYFANDRMLDRNLERFLEIDQIGTAQMYDNRKMPSYEERMAEEKIAESIKVVDGTYQVAVPWREENVEMENNLQQAKSCLEAMRKQFKIKESDLQDFLGLAIEKTDEGYSFR